MTSRETSPATSPKRLIEHTGYPDADESKQERPKKGIPFKVISEELLKRTADRDLFREKITQQLAAETAVAGIIKDEEDQDCVLLPTSIFQEDNILGSMYRDLSNECKLQIRVFDTEKQINIKDDSENYFIGLWFGVLATENQKRTRAKKDIELGKAESFALRVRAEFNAHPKLGMGALTLDNFFFGNNPTEKGKFGPVQLDIKSKWQALIDGDIKQVNGLYSIFLYFCNYLRLKNQSEDTYIKTLLYNIVPFDNVIKSYMRPVFSQKGKKSILTGYRKPNLPVQSPVLLPGENELIKRLFTPFFSSFSPLQKDWLDNVLHYSFKGITSQLNEEFNERWELLSKFAKLTTKRLQALRESKVVDEKTKKAGVTKTQLQAFFSKVEKPQHWLLRTLLNVISDKHLKRSVAGLGYGFPANLEDARKLLSAEITAMYIACDVIKEIHEDIADVQYIKDFNDNLPKVMDILGKLSNNARNISKTGNALGNSITKIPGQFRGLSELIKSTEKRFKSLSQLTNYEELLHYALTAMGAPVETSDSMLSTWDQRITNLKDYIERTLSYLEKDIASIPRELLAGIEATYKDLGESYDSWKSFVKGKPV